MAKKPKKVAGNLTSTLGEATMTAGAETALPPATITIAAAMLADVTNTALIAGDSAALTTDE